MIVFNLKCRKEHLFEAWFRDNATFDQQVAAGAVGCPVCGSKKVAKALMAPHVAKSGRAEQAARETAKVAQAKKAFSELRRQVEENCDYVGPTFAEEARKIHYGESDERNIYGETSNEEAKALDEEGVKVQRIPWLPRENS
jgi:hypothetical protein